MTNEIVKILEDIEKLAKGNDMAKVEKALKDAQIKTAALKHGKSEQLAEEIRIWQNKLPVIWKEPVGRQGMSKHARHWIEELHKLGVGSSELGAKKK